MVNIRRDMVPASLINDVSYGPGSEIEGIVIHETANTSKGANAASHARLQKNGNSRSASWHYQVDEIEAVQSFEDDIQCWHAGSGSYNRNYIGIEICVNSDGDFRKAVENAAELVKHLMEKHGIPKSKIVTHKTASGWKDCPHYLRSGSKGIDWNGFLKLIDGKSGSVETSKPAASKPASGGNKQTNSITEYLDSIGVNSSFSNREKLAKQYGISGYKGTADQNLKLLDKMRSGAKPAASKPAATKKGDQKTSSITEYLDSIGVNSSFSNREKLAKQYGISGYKGTAAQNTKLLGLMRKGSAPKAAKKGDQKTTSLVDYLKSIGASSSFSNREKLAKQYGIKGYKGTASQNTQLLNKMRG
jgi:N-acetylmuramoyl-L-alanine amidase